MTFKHPVLSNYTSNSLHKGIKCKSTRDSQANQPGTFSKPPRMESQLETLAQYAFDNLTICNLPATLD